MRNKVTNASGLDGTTGWAGTGLAVDETVRGAPGRRAITATGQLDSAAAYEIAVAVGESVEVFGSIWASAGTVSMEARWFDGGVFDAAQPAAVENAGTGTGTRGLRGTYATAYWRGVAPLTGTLRLRVQSTDGGATVALVKPWAAVDAPEMAASAPRIWAPGPHVNPDLDLPLWPENLGQPLLGVPATPTPMRRAFETDARVPTTALINPTPWLRLDVPMILDLEQRDALEVFLASRAEPFWLVRPDTDALCRAWWRQDGEPIDAFVRPDLMRTTVGLLLEPA